MYMIKATEVPMTPNKEISWNTFDVNGGKLYVNPSAPTGFDPMQLFRAIRHTPNDYETIGDGYDGVIKEIGDFALKQFDRHSEMAEYRLTRGMVQGDLPDLRANVDLTEGLKIVPQIDTVSFDIRGVEIHAAYMPDDQESEIMWLMEKLEPITDAHYPEYSWTRINERGKTYYPNTFQRRRLYGDALHLIGLDIHHMEVDDVDANRLLTVKPYSAQRGIITKIDAQAEPKHLHF